MASLWNCTAGHQLINKSEQLAACYLMSKAWHLVWNCLSHLTSSELFPFNFIDTLSLQVVSNAAFPVCPARLGWLRVLEGLEVKGPWCSVTRAHTLCPVGFVTAARSGTAGHELWFTRPVVQPARGVSSRQPSHTSSTVLFHLLTGVRHLISEVC